MAEQKATEIVVPQCRKEEKELKLGFKDEDKSDISYFNFGLFWPNVIANVFIIATTLVAVHFSLKRDYFPSVEEIHKGYRRMYGRSIISCEKNITLPEHGLPSVLNLFETNVSGNILFRLVVCYPMAIRFFNSLVFRMKASQEGSSFVHNLINNVTPLFTLVECVSLALFAVITTHSDFAGINYFSRKVFAASSAGNMAMSTVVMLSHSRRSDSNIDLVSLVVKVICSVLYCYLIPQISTDPFRTEHICHSYLPRVSAIKEYAAIVIYVLFHLTTIADVRDLRFLCYPRNCSGECEPVDPENFAKGAKYEHCRSWEYQQHKQGIPNKKTIIIQ